MINSIAIKGIGSYGEEETLVRFGQGKNVVVGETGTGKSALLFAIEVGFLGSLEGWDLNEVINDDSKEAEVKIQFTHMRTGNVFEVSRAFERRKSRGKESGRQVSASLINVDTGEVLSDTPTSVDNALEHLGIDKNTFIHVVHIKQGKIDRILQPSSEQREIFDKLFGIHDIKSALATLGTRKGGIIKEMVLLNEAKKGEIRGLKSLAEDLPQWDNQLRTTLDEIENLKKEQQEKLEKLEEIKKVWEIVEPLSKTLDKIELDIRLYQNGIEQAEKNLYQPFERVRLLFPKLHQKILEIRQRAKEPKDELEILEELKKILSTGEQLEGELVRTKAEREKLQNQATELTGEQKSLQSDLKKLQDQVKRIGKFLEGKEEQPEIKCELCGSILTPQHFRKHKEDLADLEDKIQEKLTGIDESLEAVNVKLTETGRIVEQIQSEITNLKTLEPLSEQIAAQIEFKISLNEKLQSSSEQIKAVLEEFAKVLKEKIPLEKVKSKVDEIRTTVITLPTDIETLGKTIEQKEKKDLPRVNQEVEKRRRASQRIQQLEKEVESTENKIQFLISEIRPCLEDIQPVIRSMFIDSINKRAQFYFDRFYGKNSRYKREDITRIWMDNDYVFWVERQGHQKKATRISGGQGIIVSLSFIFALLDELSTLSFLLLDEPSNHLDSKRTEELINVLKELQNVPQMVIVDHHPLFKNAGDTKYEVNLEDGYSVIRGVT